MRIVIQRVAHASVAIEGEVKSAIQQGYLILLGIEESDTSEDIDWLVRKVIGLRVFRRREPCDESLYYGYKGRDIGHQPVYPIRQLQERKSPQLAKSCQTRDKRSALRRVLQKAF